jgi:hypothetical protein
VFRPLTRIAENSSILTGGSTKAQFTGHVAIPTVIKIAFLASTRFLAVTPDGGNRDFGPCGARKTRSANRFRLPDPARKNEIAGQNPYCADFLRLVHDEMLSAARASFSGWLCT